MGSWDTLSQNVSTLNPKTCPSLRSGLSYISHISHLEVPYPNKVSMYFTLSAPCGRPTPQHTNHRGLTPWSCFKLCLRSVRKKITKLIWVQRGGVWEGGRRGQENLWVWTLGVWAVIVIMYKYIVHSRFYATITVFLMSLRPQITFHNPQQTPWSAIHPHTYSLICVRTPGQTLTFGTPDMAYSPMGSGVCVCLSITQTHYRTVYALA